MQDSRHKKAPKQEMKVFTMYEGWDADSPKRSRLVNKKMLAGMEKSGQFHQKREALIEKVYEADEIGQRILNGDGGSWIKEDYDPEVIFQLDRFHIYREIKKKIRDVEAQKRIKELLEQKKVDEMLEYIQIYADSIESDDAKDKGDVYKRQMEQELNHPRFVGVRLSDIELELLDRKAEILGVSRSECLRKLLDVYKRQGLCKDFIYVKKCGLSPVFTRN